MTGLILEIQQASLDASVPIENLLRRVKLAAAKLRLEQLESWVDNELNGYSDRLPEYRKVHGQAAAWNTYNGWVPIVGNPKLMEIISTANIGQPIAGLSDLVKKEKSGGEIHLPMRAELVSRLNDIFDHPTPRIVIKVPRGAIIGILDAVRNRVLEWSIEMERQGVLGEGMTFNTIEREAARNAMNTYNIGTIGNFAGNMGSDNTSGNISLRSNDVSDVKLLIDQINAEVPKLMECGAGKDLPVLVDAMNIEIQSQQPDTQKMQGLVGDMRAALSGAAGNMLATGALSILSQISKILG
ncbi:hypothetical protein [Paracoccus endophyticus]|uniref:AbiTii domain-containing protein n=1 Tax=Paracoccus endophyticus TaxID=2233774 RepID=UPI0013A6BD18|nr:hypothetical protein [Paracoccus endophyticus]